MPRPSTPGGDAPFGYTFTAADPTDSSYPPGPPLLDNNESSLLDSFFNDPNNIDPTFLSLPSEFQSDPSNVFGSNSLEWSSHGMPAMPGSAGPVSSNLPQHQSQRPAQTRQISASADVYAAAGILHNNNNNNSNSTPRQDSSSTYDSYGYNVGNVASDGSQLNGFGIPSLPNNQASEYDFGEGNNGFYNGYQDPPNPYTTGLQNRLRGPSRNRPSAPLNFGSDDNFRESAYAAPSITELPDQKLVEAVDHNFGQDPDGSRRRKEKSSYGQMRKRRKQSPPQARKENSGDSAKTSYTANNQHPGGQGVKEEDEGDESAHSGTAVKRGRKNLGSISTTAQVSDSTAIGDCAPGEESPSLASPSKKHKTGSSNMPKDRRENLTEEQKRSNHILSEQKRRNLIKHGFEDLNRMVPELRASGLSKSNMLVEAARFMRRLRDDNDELRLQMESLDNG